ncbi:MAG: AAA family ATPase, partial [Candidatus Margulisbacteria bacterium]|nr:AAA family ATPase [Candidatus Margulisiibacteriota bacterium]
MTLQNRVFTFIGMPGVGKSTIGKSLAKHLQYDFIDIDQIIVREMGQPIAEIIQMKGVQTFKDLEETTVLNLGPLHHTIISTGGSLVYSHPAMNWLSKHSTIIYLKDSLNNIQKR